MSVSSILSSGMQSMQAGINRSAIAAGRIASPGFNADTGAMANNMVELNQGAIDAKIAADVIKTGDQMLGTLIDIRG